MTNAIDILGLNKNKRETPQFQSASVLKKVNGTITRIPFNFAMVVGNKFALSSTALPGLEVSTPTKVIRTHRVDIPFVQGDSIEINGSVWSVADVEVYWNNKSAQMTGQAQQGWTLYLNGGKGSVK